MIRILSQGGLGNQLFIWNLAHLLAENSNKKIEIFYNKDNSPVFRRDFELGRLTHHCRHGILLKERRVTPYLFSIHDKIQSSKFRKINFLKKIANLEEVIDPFGGIKIKEKPNQIIRGFFQNQNLVEAGWKNIAIELESLFESIKTENFYKKISLLPFEKYQVLHFRRGAYEINKDSLGILTIDYYRSKTQPNLKSIICFDDESLRTKLENEFPEAIIMSPKEFNTWETLAVMCSADNLIMANSTLSWWAAHFVLAKGKKAISPKPWHKNQFVEQSFLEFDGLSFAESDFEE